MHSALGKTEGLARLPELQCIPLCMSLAWQLTQLLRPAHGREVGNMLPTGAPLVCWEPVCLPCASCAL